MEKRPLIPADTLFRAIKSRSHKVTMALMHPEDMGRMPIDTLRLMLGGADILPSTDVERNMLFVSIQALK